MRVALVKMSSMGDVIHALPIVNDLLAARPGITIDWVVDEVFADLPRLHPGLSKVFPVAVRRWRRRWHDRSIWREVRQARAELGERRYDVVLDLQGLLKSVLVASWMRGERVGYARACAREPLASLFYQRRYHVDMTLHAVEKMRSLAGQAFGYESHDPPFFGLSAPDMPASVANDGPFRVFLHATSRVDKQWPQREWVSLLRDSRAQGRAVYLPWGNQTEHAAACELARLAGHGIVLPRLDLAGCAGLLAAAEAVVGVDTGLTHLAAALDVPTVALFAATESWRYGPYWSRRAVSLGQAGQWPSAITVGSHLAALLAAPR